MRIWDLDVNLISLGRFRLDGGAMFGIVPKPIWEKLFESDERNRIELGLNVLLIKDENEEYTLVDSGISYNFSEKEMEIYQIRRRNRDFPIDPKKVSRVILTHLHFDHAGLCSEGNPVFSEAEHIVQRREWEAALNPNERTRASYKLEDLLPIEEQGLLRKISGSKRLDRGIRVIRTGGHTQGHQVVLVGRGKEKGIYLGDLVPTSKHVPFPYIMGYDLFPLENLKWRKKLYEKISKENWIVFFEHDPDPTFGRISLKEKEAVFTPL